MDNSAASRKDLEANGHVEDTPSEGSSEQLNPYHKRSRRMEYVYISIAVVLGAALIAVLVYYSVTNAQKDDPVAVSSMESVSTTTDYDDLFGNIGGEVNGEDSQLGGLLPSDMTRAGNRFPNTGNTGQTATTESTNTLTTTEAPERTFRILRRVGPGSLAQPSENEDDADNTNGNEDTDDVTTKTNTDETENMDNDATNTNTDGNGDTDGAASNTDENGEDETGTNVQNNGGGSEDVPLVRTLRRLDIDNNSTSTTVDEGGSDVEGDNSGNPTTN